MDKSKLKTIQITPELQARLDRKKSSYTQSGLDDEWLLVAEMGMFYGWPAIEAALGKDIYNENGEISAQLRDTLLIAGRKLKARDRYESAASSFIGSVSASSKKPGEAFERSTKHYIKEMRN